MIFDREQFNCEEEAFSKDFLDTLIESGEFHDLQAVIKTAYAAGAATVAKAVKDGHQIELDGLIHDIGLITKEEKEGFAE